LRWLLLQQTCMYTNLSHSSFKIWLLPSRVLLKLQLLTSKAHNIIQWFKVYANSFSLEPGISIAWRIGIHMVEIQRQKHPPFSLNLPPVTNFCIKHANHHGKLAMLIMQLVTLFQPVIVKATLIMPKQVHVNIVSNHQNLLSYSPPLMMLMENFQMLRVSNSAMRATKIAQTKLVKKHSSIWLLFVIMLQIPLLYKI